MNTQFAQMFNLQLWYGNPLNPPVYKVSLYIAIATKTRDKNIAFVVMDI